MAARRALDEYLETVPLNKLLAFGGDYKHVELTYAHAKMARWAIAQVLAAKVENGFCTEQEAREIGRMILYENAARLFSGVKPEAAWLAQIRVSRLDSSN